MSDASSSIFRNEAYVDEMVLDELTFQASFAADRVYLQRIHDPGVTDAALTRYVVGAALRNLLANRLVTSPPVEAIRARISEGVTLR